MQSLRQTRWYFSPEGADKVHVKDTCQLMSIKELANNRTFGTRDREEYDLRQN